MSGFRSVKITTQPLLPSKSKVPPYHRRNSIDAVRQHLFDSCEQCRRHGVALLQEGLRKAKSETEKYRLQNAALHSELNTQHSYKMTLCDRIWELRAKNIILEGQLQCSEEIGEELGKKFNLALCNDYESILQVLCKQNELIRQEKVQILEQNVSLGNRLESLQHEVVTLREATARHEHERSSLKNEVVERQTTLAKERVKLKKDVDLHMQKLKTAEQNEKQLAEEVKRLQQELDRLQDSSHPCPKQTCMETRAQRDQLAGNLTRRCERQECVSASADLEDVKKRITQMRKRRCNYEHCKNEQLKDMNELQQDLYRPCQRQTCVETRTERDQLARKLMRKCERQECVSASADLEDVKKRITQMRKRRCNYEHCKNEQLKDMNDTIGSKVRIDGREYSHSEALQQLVERQHPGQSEEVKSLQSRLQRMQVENQEFQSHLQSNSAGRCTRSDCQRIEERLKRMQSEHTQGQNAAKDMALMCGGEYDEPLEEFNEVFTNPDELLGVLERCVEPFQAKKMLCKIFERAYDLCKTAALTRTRQTLDDLFTVSEDKSRKAVLGEISRAYGLLLHVSGLKNDKATCRDICCKIVTELTSDEAVEAYNRVGRALQAEEEYLLKCVQVAWKFVTLPSPIIVSQPQAYNPQIVDREYGYWDESTPDTVLIYTRPVVYRCYDGNRAEKGMVANTDICNKPA